MNMLPSLSPDHAAYYKKLEGFHWTAPRCDQCGGSGFHLEHANHPGGREIQCGECDGSGLGAAPEDARFVIEVQHSSDRNRDGRWFEIDRTDDIEVADSRAETITAAYHGRPVRVLADGERIGLAKLSAMAREAKLRREGLRQVWAEKRATDLNAKSEREG